MRVVIGLGTVYTCQSGTWATVGGAGGGGTVTGVLGTTNQINSDGSATTPTVSLSSTLVLPGTLTSSGVSLFQTTTANSTFFGVKNTTAAVIGTSQGSPVLSLCGRAFHGSADVEDCTTLKELPGNGNDAAIIFSLAHTGTSTGTWSMQVPSGSATNPAYSFSGIATAGLYNSSGTILATQASTNIQLLVAGGAGWTFMNTGGEFKSNFAGSPLGDSSNPWGSLFLSRCSNGASPAVCGTNATGSVAVPTGTNPTLTINTTAVTANSQIFLQIDEGATIAATTCNTTLSTLVQPVVTARIAATSFTIQIGAIIATNPACVHYSIVN